MCIYIYIYLECVSGLDYEAEIRHNGISQRLTEDELLEPFRIYVYVKGVDDVINFFGFICIKSSGATTAIYTTPCRRLKALKRGKLRFAAGRGGQKQQLDKTEKEAREQIRGDK